MGQVEIYGLHDPSTDELRYVGKAKSAAARLKSHLRDMKGRQTPLYDWMRKLIANGQMPVCRVICVCDADEWQGVERREIAKARATSSRILNLADGGDEPFCPTNVRAANGKANSIARADTPKKKRLFHLKLVLGLLLKGGYVSEATKVKIRAAATTHPHVFAQWAGI